MTHEICLVHVRKSTLGPLKGRVSLFGYLSVQFVHFRVKRVVIDTRTSGVISPVESVNQKGKMFEVKRISVQGVVVEIASIIVHDGL